MHNPTSLKALRAIAFSLASLSACAISMAGDATTAPFMLAKADTSATSQLVRASSPAPMESTNEALASYPSVAEAELIGMGYESFDAILAEALGTPTAAGYSAVPSRGAIEAVVARTMGGLMP